MSTIHHTEARFTDLLDWQDGLPHRHLTSDPLSCSNGHMRVYNGIGTEAVARAVRYWNEESLKGWGSEDRPDQLPWLTLGELRHEPTIRVNERSLVGRAGECERHSNGSASIRIDPRYISHWLVVAHEIGHAMGLEHDDDHPVMASTFHMLRTH